MVVDPEVDRDVVEAAVAGLVAYDEQRRRLASTPVTAGVVAGPERGEEASGERLVDRRSQASFIASTTSGPTRMLPWIATPSPVTPPAQSKQSEPVWVAAPPSTSTRPTWRSSRFSSSSSSRRRATSAVAPSSRWERAMPL